MKAYSLKFTAILLIFLAGCAAGPLRDARKAFYSNRPLDAVNALSQVSETKHFSKHFSNRDKLLLLMEKGLILNHIGNYQESADALLEASKLIEQQEVISVTEQTASLVTTEWLTSYKGEYSERLWVHTYLMMNFLVLGKYESAQVEARKSLKLFEKYPKSLSGDYFSRALIALCFENMGNLNDAHIEYKKLAKLMSSPRAVAPELWQTARGLGFSDDAEKYRRFIPGKTLSLYENNQRPAELILFAGLGNIATKVPGNIMLPPSIRFSFPVYEKSFAQDRNITVSDSVLPLPLRSVSTNLSGVVKSSLKDRAAKIIIKETARATAKEAISQAVERKNKDIAGVLVRMAFFLLEEPDTRCWQTLPGILKLIRVPLRPGKHGKIIIRGGRTGGDIVLPEMNVSPGQRIFHSIRLN